MDDARGARGLVTDMDGPCAALVGAGREERPETEQAIRALDQADDAGLFQPHLLQKHLTVLIFLDLSDFRFGFRRNHQDFRLLVTDRFADLFDVGIALGGGSLVHVADIHHRLVGQQEQVPGHLGLFRIFRHDGPAGFALQQDLPVTEQQRQEFLRILVTAGRRLFLDLLDAVFHRLQVLDLQFHIHDLLVPDRIDGPVHVDDVPVVETTEDMEDGVRLPDIGKELVAKTFPLAGPLDEAGDVDDFHRGGDGPLRLADLRQHLQAPVRHVGGTDVRFNGAEREIGALGLAGADTVEQGGFPDVRESDDTAFE